MPSEKNTQSTSDRRRAALRGTHHANANDSSSRGTARRRYPARLARHQDHRPGEATGTPYENRVTRTTLTAAATLLAVGCLTTVAADDPKPFPVTVENFRRAESDLYFGNVVKDGGFGKFLHRREPAAIDNQTVIRLNRDTFYSAAVFDLDAGPVTITLPDAGKRFMSMQVINEDQYSLALYYGAGKHTLTREAVGTRYVITAIRTLIVPANPNDAEEVHKLHEAIQLDQKSPGKFEVPN